MRIAFARHGLLADLRSVALSILLLGLPASLALPAATALASTGGASAQASATETTAEATAPTAGSTSTGGSAPTGSQSHKDTLATWFGPGFYGHTTACGQTMTPTLLGVASRTLACGTLVQVTYRGHQLTVPVLDRGPYGHIGAAWDLTAGAARALKITETVHIATAIVGSVPNTPLLGQAPEASSPEASGTPAAAGAAPSAAASTTGGATAG
jgi:rare lipoprotein A